MTQEQLHKQLCTVEVPTDATQGYFYYCRRKTANAAPLQPFGKGCIVH